jgi:hypothetical protein
MGRLQRSVCIGLCYARHLHALLSDGTTASGMYHGITAAEAVRLTRSCTGLLYVLNLPGSYMRCHEVHVCVLHVP